MDRDVLREKAGDLELGRVDRAQIEKKPGAAASSYELSRELRGDFSADLVAAGADRGAEPGP